MKKTDDVEFMNLAVKHDIIAIYETWAVADKSEDVKRFFFNNFCELNPAVKLSKYGRASGGVAVYVTNTLKTQVNRINNDFKFWVIFTVWFYSHLVLSVYIVNTRVHLCIKNK